MRGLLLSSPSGVTLQPAQGHVTTVTTTRLSMVALIVDPIPCELTFNHSNHSRAACRRELAAVPSPPLPRVCDANQLSAGDPRAKECAVSFAHSHASHPSFSYASREDTVIAAEAITFAAPSACAGREKHVFSDCGVHRAAFNEYGHPTPHPTPTSPP